MRSRYFLLLLGLLLIPQTTFAHEFLSADSLFFNAGSGFYRQKTDSKPWQLVSLPEQPTVKQTLVFGDRVYTVVERDSKQRLLVQNERPLQFDLLTGVSEADKITLKVISGQLVIFSTLNATATLQILSISGDLVTVSPSLIGSVSQLSRLVSVDNQLFYLQQFGEKIIVWRYYSGGWVMSAEPQCQNSQVLTEPIVGLFCQDGSIIYYQPNNSWPTLNLAPLRQVYSSNTILAGWDLADENLFHVWSNGRATSVQVPTLTAHQTDRITLISHRVLLREASNNWFELLWQETLPIISEITGSVAGEVIKAGVDEQLFITSSPPLLSSASRNWQTLIVVGQFTSARQTPLGYLLWNTGSLTQFAPTGSTVFTKVNPWSSTTSPIQAVEIGSTTSFVSVITQSGNGNVNLYKTTDFVHWNRITLPTKPTLSPPISQARQLVAGSLVELSGVITVGPKVVGSEILYLEDASAGIQVFLSQTSGLLPAQTKINAVTTGEISSSQTKRVLLSSLTDLELGSSTNWIQPTINTNEASDHLGQSVNLKGTVSDTDTDYLVLGDLKLHFVSAKTIFQKDDQLLIPAVIDWNSASGKNEAWALSADYQLISRTQPPSPTATTSTKSETTNATPKKAVVAKKASSSKVAINLPSSSTAAGISKPADTPVIVAAAQSSSGNDGNRTISMSLVSLIAGLVSFRGRRFRRFLLD